jgi:hypothetical protein
MNDFDLKKYLIENKITTNSRLSENNSQLEPYKKGKLGSSFGYKLTKAPNVNELLENVKYIDGYLDLSRSNITILPDYLEINGYLSLSNTKINSLPKGLIVRGDLDLLNCKNITSIPNDLIVNGNLILNSKKFDKNDLKNQLPGVNNITIVNF